MGKEGGSDNPRDINILQVGLQFFGVFEAAGEQHFVFAVKEEHFYIEVIDLKEQGLHFFAFAISYTYTLCYQFPVLLMWFQCPEVLQCHNKTLKQYCNKGSAIQRLQGVLA